MPSSFSRSTIETFQSSPGLPLAMVVNLLTTSTISIGAACGAAGAGAGVGVSDLIRFWGAGLEAEAGIGGGAGVGAVGLGAGAGADVTGAAGFCSPSFWRIVENMLMSTPSDLYARLQPCRLLRLHV